MGKLILLLGFVALLHFMGAGKLVGLGEPGLDFSGDSFTQAGPITARDAYGNSIEFGLEFLDAERVDMIANGTKSGPTMTYVIKGKKMFVTHACGKWEVDIRDDGTLYEIGGDRVYAADPAF